MDRQKQYVSLAEMKRRNAMLKKEIERLNARIKQQNDTIDRLRDMVHNTVSMYTSCRAMR